MLFLVQNMRSYVASYGKEFIRKIKILKLQFWNFSFSVGKNVWMKEMKTCAAFLYCEAWQKVHIWWNFKVDTFYLKSFVPIKPFLNYQIFIFLVLSLFLCIHPKIQAKLMIFAYSFKRQYKSLWQLRKHWLFSSKTKKKTSKNSILFETFIDLHFHVCDVRKGKRRRQMYKMKAEGKNNTHKHLGSQ